MPKLKFKPQAILFDMDGVIVDSMPYHFISWYEALKAYGVTVNSFDIYAKEGERWDLTLPYFLKRHNIQPTKKLMQKMVKYKQKIFKKYFTRHIFEGAQEILIKCLKKGLQLGLVTGTPLYTIKKILPKHIYRLFNVIVSGDIVQHGKPHPEPYLLAAKKIGISPSKCLVIENAPLGIASAKAARMKCIAIETSLPKPYLKQADQVIESILELSRILFK